MATVRFTYVHTCELNMTKKREKAILAYILPQKIAEISAKAGAYSPQTFFLFFYFFSPKLSYVPFVLARDHLGKLEMEK